jgi:hypothetical protein
VVLRGAGHCAGRAGAIKIGNALPAAAFLGSIVGCVHAERGITLVLRNVRVFDGEKVWDRTNLLVRRDPRGQRHLHTQAGEKDGREAAQEIDEWAWRGGAGTRMALSRSGAS